MLDAVSVGYDVYDIYNNGLNWETGTALAVDVGGLVVPFVPAPSACVRWCDDVLQYGDEVAGWVGNKADEGWQAAKRAAGYGDEATDAGRAADNVPCLTNSFSGDTLVMTAAGAKPIAEFVEGDLVLAYNEATGKIEVHPITDTISHIDPEIVLLSIDGELLETTAEHPFYELEAVPGLAVGQYHPRWTDATDLQTGDRIWQADGTTGVVQAVEVVAHEQRMYNLTVDVAHTFFVGRGQWLVHNCSGSVVPGSNLRRFKNHYVRHKDLLGNVTGKKYARWRQSNQGQEFLEDLGQLVDSGRLAYEGMGTLKKGADPAKIFRGEGVTLLLRESGEFWTLLRSGEGLDTAIQMLP